MPSKGGTKRQSDCDPLKDVLPKPVRKLLFAHDPTRYRFHCMDCIDAGNSYIATVGRRNHR